MILLKKYVNSSNQWLHLLCRSVNHNHLQVQGKNRLFIRGFIDKEYRREITVTCRALFFVIFFFPLRCLPPSFRFIKCNKIQYSFFGRYQAYVSNTSDISSSNMTKATTFLDFVNQRKESINILICSLFAGAFLKWTITVVSFWQILSNTCCAFETRCSPR